MKKNPVGRPKKSLSDRLKSIEVTFETVFELAKTGLTDKQLGKVFGVSEVTINDWKKKSPEFALALKKGKDFADSLVETALYRRALGFKVDTEVLKVVSQGQGRGSKIERVPIKVYYPPDTTAAIFWLKNRKSSVWRDKMNLDIEVFNSFKAEVLEALRVLPQEHRHAFIAALQVARGR